MAQTTPATARHAGAGGGGLSLTERAPPPTLPPRPQNTNAPVTRMPATRMNRKTDLKALWPPPPPPLPPLPPPPLPPAPPPLPSVSGMSLLMSARGGGGGGARVSVHESIARPGHARASAPSSLHPHTRAHVAMHQPHVCVAHAVAAVAQVLQPPQQQQRRSRDGGHVRRESDRRSLAHPPPPPSPSDSPGTPRPPARQSSRTCRPSPASSRTRTPGRRPWCRRRAWSG